MTCEHVTCEHVTSRTDGRWINAQSAARTFCCFYLPKLLLAAAYVGIASVIFLLHGRVPDRLNLSPGVGSSGGAGFDVDATQTELVAALCASVIAVGLWLSCLVSRAVYRLGWKKVEYIYTEREKSFVGITIVFVTLWLCGHLYRAVHGARAYARSNFTRRRRRPHPSTLPCLPGRRGSWMQLQLPFLTLTKSYLALLTHAFWPAEREVAPNDANAQGELDDEEEERKGQGLLGDDDDDDD